MIMIVVTVSVKVLILMLKILKANYQNIYIQYIFLTLEKLTTKPNK